MRMLPSSEPLARFPLLSSSRHVTSCVCPFKVLIIFREVVLPIFIELSFEPLAIRMLSTRFNART